MSNIVYRFCKPFLLNSTVRDAEAQLCICVGVSKSKARKKLIKNSLLLKINQKKFKQIKFINSSTPDIASS